MYTTSELSNELAGVGIYHSPTKTCIKTDSGGNFYSRPIVDVMCVNYVEKIRISNFIFKQIICIFFKI